ncbi:MAG: hypothetical protein UX81_C0003G0022 [Parcubacteria group bacterium GW2011_GWA2_47_12]|uniref:Radical SAM core domain-containing protein n=1 Tax=Candidatus Giovannonibacteria bacterium RIFCSPLOWO2_01_FULL_44_16 TaxID=1798348 RepID=A0A1F5X1I0_9BACT|nr:MAG: hypothetical protein UX81_C0003G0022 [Parcubacteria group bacterium GW2011_GWA2_47_12]OGF81758.1 MAG: hypothetical protein A2924_00940 [Candidatus Giovannonibacteria bacterium RIFCSPLOWO2_01_FULL_44_16]
MKMKIFPRKLSGAFEVVTEVFSDNRGSMERIYDKSIFESFTGFDFVQDSLSYTKKKNTVRGFHVSLPPSQEGKIITAAHGKMLWVIVDIRKGSHTFGQWDMIVLSPEKRNMLCVTRGFAHGCLSLTDDACVSIKADNSFSDEHVTGIIWNDPTLKIDWPLNGAEPIISEAHRKLGTFADFVNKYGGLPGETKYLNVVPNYSAERVPTARMRFENSLLIPRRVTIETIFECNFHCPMCPIDLPSRRTKGPMEWDLYKKIIDELVPYREHIEMMDLFSLGEPLMDRLIFKRIKYAKDTGFKNLGISTNASLLTARNQKLFFESGIDNIIFSIDGATKETYEAIRVGGNFEKVIANCTSAIALRNKGNYKTKFLVRFTRQDKNRREWPEFCKFWESKIDRSRGDFLGVYEAHTWGGTTGNKNDILHNGRDEAIEKLPCYLIYDILNILADGTVPMCHEDWLNGGYNCGNVKDAGPIEVFNSSKYRKYREIHSAGDKAKMKICKGCTVLYSESTKQYF